MILDVFNFLCSKMFLNTFICYMVCLINADAIFNICNGDIEELTFGTFLVCIAKEGVKLVSQYIKVDTMLCGNKYTICLYCKNRLIRLIISIE